MSALPNFTVDESSQAGGHARFQQEMQRHFAIGLEVHSSRSEPFHTRVDGYNGGRLRFASIRFTPHTTSSLHGMRDSRLLVSQQKEGITFVSQGGRESRIEPGDLFVIDPTQPFLIETGSILTHSVYVESAVLRTAVPELETLTARAVKTDDGAGAIFRSLLDELFVRAPALQEDAADHVADALPHLLTGALSTLLRDRAPAPSRLRLLHRQRVLRYMRENLRDPELDAGAIASAAKLSTRYLYDLFSPDECSPMKRVWSMRLERCHAELANPGLAGRSVGEIAFGWGFSDLAHFSRSFHKRYGMSPRDFRRSSKQD